MSVLRTYLVPGTRFVPHTRSVPCSLFPTTGRGDFLVILMSSCCAILGQFFLARTNQIRYSESELKLKVLLSILDTINTFTSMDPVFLKPQHHLTWKVTFVYIIIGQG